MLRILRDRVEQATNPQNIDHIATGAAEREIPLKSPRYRGAFSVADHDNTGVIGGHIMNKNDWIAYTGITEGKWEHGYCYEWTGSEWKKLEVTSENMGKYTTAVSDLVQGAPNGYFSILFCKTLVAVDAFIENLYMQNGVLNENGSIQSKEFVSQAQETPQNPAKGFLIKANGDAEFNNIRTKGMHAYDMTTHGLTVMERLTVELDAQLQNINGIPINQFARIHQADSLDSMDYPIGSIILAGSAQDHVINEIVSPRIGSIYDEMIMLSGSGTFLPGTWRSSGGTPSSHIYLVRRVS